MQCHFVGVKTSITENQDQGQATDTGRATAAWSSEKARESDTHGEVKQNTCRAHRNNVTKQQTAGTQLLGNTEPQLVGVGAG